MESATFPSHPRSGKHGVLEMTFERDERQRSILRRLHRQTPIIVQQALYFDEQMPELPCVYILSSGGPVVDGDSYSQSILLRHGACAHISTGAATKVAQMSGGEAEMHQRWQLDEDSYLEYLPEPTIPCRGARWDVECEIQIAPSATMFHSEIFLSGRRHSGERFCYGELNLRCNIRRPDGSLLFSERALIDPSRGELGRLGVMGNWEIFSTVMILSPADTIPSIESAIEPFIGEQTALAIHRLPNHAGLMCRIVGRESQDVKRLVRELCSRVRQRIKGRALAADFPWR